MARWNVLIKKDANGFGHIVRCREEGIELPLSTFARQHFERSLKLNLGTLAAKFTFDVVVFRASTTGDMLWLHSDLREFIMICFVLTAPGIGAEGVA